MIVSVNGIKEPVPSGSVLSEFLEKKNLIPDSVVVEINMKLIDQSSFDHTRLQDSDKIEILHFVGGG